MWGHRSTGHSTRRHHRRTTHGVTGAIDDVDRGSLFHLGPAAARPFVGTMFRMLAGHLERGLFDLGLDELHIGFFVGVNRTARGVSLGDVGNARVFFFWSADVRRRGVPSDYISLLRDNRKSGVYCKRSGFAIEVVIFRKLWAVSPHNSECRFLRHPRPPIVNRR